MNNETDTTKRTPKKGTPILQVALLLFIIGAVMGLAGSAPLAWIFIPGAIVCAIIGLVQKDSAPN